MNNNELKNSLNALVSSFANETDKSTLRPATYLSEISENTKETKEHVKGISTNVEDMNNHIAELYKKVAQLNADLEAERQRADKAVSRARWFTFFITLLSVLFSYWLNHH